MKNKIRNRALKVALILVVATSSCKLAIADSVVFSNLEPTPPYYAGSGTGIPSGFETANFFAPSATVDLTRVLLPLTLSSGTPSSLSVSVYSANGSSPAQTPLATGTLSYSASGLSEVVFSSGTALLSGTTYWIGVASGLGTTVSWWDTLNSLSASEPFRLTADPAVWQSNTGGKGAFEVYGTTPVPLPAAVWLLLSGLGGLGALRLRKS